MSIFLDGRGESYMSPCDGILLPFFKEANHVLSTSMKSTGSRLLRLLTIGCLVVGRPVGLHVPRGRRPTYSPLYHVVTGG